jgi:alpha-L-fucosidase
MIPDLIIGSRFRADENGYRHYDTNGDLIGDYEQGWERKLPESIDELNRNDWDCVMTIPTNQWGYHSDWRGYVKSSVELLEMLVKSVSLDGNFVLNFGPDGLGQIRAEETQIAQEIGEWMSINSEAIYGCGYAELEKQDWGYFTKNRKNNQHYMIVFNVPISGGLKVNLKEGLSIKNAIPIDDNGVNKNLKIERYNNNEYIIKLDNRIIENPIVIKLTFEQINSKNKIDKAKT